MKSHRFLWIAFLVFLVQIVGRPPLVCEKYGSSFHAPPPE